MSIRELRQSKIFRIISFFLLINFLTGQNFYGTEFHVQEGTGLYAPTVGVAEKELETSGLSPSSAASDSLAEDFVDEGPLSAAESLAPVSTVAPDPALTSANLTNFSGSPWVRLMPGSSSASSLVQQSAGSFFIKYDVSAAGSKAGVLVSFDKPTTAGVETQDLSSMTDFVVGLWGPSGSKVRFEVEDLLGAKSEVLLINVSSATQYYRVSKTLFAGVDWTKIKQFIYSVDGGLVTNLVGTIGISTKTLLYTNEVVTNLPATPHVEVGEAANAPTSLVQSNANGFKWNYDVTAAGSVSSASVAADNPGTSAAETLDLSGSETFTFGIWGPAGSRVRLEFEDASGAKSSVLLTDVQWTTRYYTFGKDAFTGIDWTKIARINFTIDKTMVTAPVSGFGISTRSLLHSSELLTDFPNSPFLELYGGSSAATNLIQTGSSLFHMNYDVSQAGSVSGASVVLDNPATTTVETANLSGYGQFSFGMWSGSVTKLKIEFEDALGAKSSVVLAGITPALQYFVLSKEKFTGLDWTQIKKIHFVLDGSMVTNPLGAIALQVKTLNYTNASVSNFPAAPHVEVGEAANAPTSLVQSNANGFKWNYDVTAAGSVSSASVAADNPGTSAVETLDLSSWNQFTFGIYGPTGSKVRLEFEDASGAKSSVLLTDVQWMTRYYTFGKDAFTGLDWTKIARINFVVDKTMVTAPVSGFGISAKTLLYNNYGVLTNFPNTPSLELYGGSSRNTNLMQTGSGQFRLSYNVSQAGSVSGASAVLDNPATTVGETADLSSYEQFSFGMWSAGTAKLKIEFEDASGIKSAAVLTGISPALQYFVISKEHFAAGIDWTKIRKINFLVDPSLVTSLINTIWIQAKTLTFNAELLTSFPGSPRAHIMAGSTPETLLRQTSNSSFALDFSLSGTGTKSGAGISFDNPNTPSLESRNLSSFKQFVFSAGGVANGKLKIEMEDTSGRKSSTVINSLSTASRYYTLSRDLFSSIDLTKVLRITFSVDSTLSPVNQGTLVIGTRTLLYNGSAASWLRGTPSPMILEGSSSGSYLVSTNPWVMNLRYDVSVPGSVSGVSFSADNPLTSAVETSDLLYDSTLRIGIKASSSSVKKIRLEVEDDLGGKASLVLTGLTTSAQYYSIQESLLAGVDWTRVTRLNLVLDPSLISSTAANKGTVYLTINGFLYTKTIAPTSGLTAANLTTLPSGGSLFLLPGSSTGSTLSEGSSQLNLSYDLTAPQTISGARVNYDIPSTPAIETGNFSGLTSLVFGLKSPSTMVRVKLTDLDGHSASVFLTDVSTPEKFFSIPTSSFTGVDLTRIRAVDFLLDPFVAGQAPDTGNLQVSLKGLVPPALSVPTVDAVPALTNQKKLLLSGTKSPGTGIAVNGKMILVPTDSTTWQAEVDLEMEGDNVLQVQETTGAGVHGPVNEIHVFLDTIPPSGSMVINDGDPYTDSRDVTLALTASDGGSDLEVMRFSIDGGNQWFDWESVATLKALRLPQWDGAKEVLYQLRDHAGNIATFSDSIILETGVPQIIVTSPAITNRTDYTFTYVVDGVSKSRSENLDQGDGDYTLSVTEPDDEGNIATVDFKVTLNTSLLVQPKSGIFTIDLDSTIQGATEIVSLMKELSKKFLSAAQDVYDFLVFVPTFSTAGILQAVAGLTGWGVSARKPVEGIGRSNFDTRPAFGSSIPDGELEHTVYFYSNFSRPDVNIDLLSNQTLFNWVFLHELGHYWLQTLSANGNSSSNPLGILAGDSHWSPFFNAGSSPMRGFDWIDNGDGTFTVHHGNKDFWLQHPGEVAAYNDFDLYAMGLLSPEEVHPSWVIDNPTLPDGRSLIVKNGTSYVVNADGTEEAYQLFAGDIVSGERREITIQDILAIEGPRFPQHPFTQKDFSLAFVVVDDPAADPSDWIQTVTKLNQFSGQTQAVWEEGTARRSGIDLAPVSVSETLAPEIEFRSPAISNDPNYTLVYTVDGVEKREDIILQEGKNNLIREAVGANGKRRVASFTITLDTVAPTGTVKINNEDTYTLSRDVTLILTGSDDTSGVDQMRFSTDGGDSWSDWEPFAVSKSLTLLLEDGIKEVQVELKDKAGFISAVFKDTIILDTVAPKVHLISEAYAYHRHYQLHYRVDDLHSEESDVKELIELAPGKNEIARTITDAAGNSSDLLWEVILDENSERGIFFDYNDKNQVIKRIDANGKETLYDYNSSDQLSKITYPDGSFSRFTYDSNGAIRSTENELGTELAFIDGSGLWRFFKDARGLQISYEYDDLGRLTEKKYADITLTYRYNELHLLTEIREKKGDGPEKITTFDYQRGFYSRTLPNGVRTRYLYDLNTGLLTDFIHEQMSADGSATLLVSFSYQRNEAGKIIKTIERRDSGSSQITRTTQYFYDVFNQLSEEIDSMRGTTQYQYDPAGNRILKVFTPTQISLADPKVVIRYAYGVDNRLMSLSEEKYDQANVLIMKRDENFIYDAQGNLVQKITPEATYHYTYNYENKLESWTDGKNFVQFLYNALGHRVGKRVNGSLTYYLVDPSIENARVVAEIDSSFQDLKTYTYGYGWLSVSDSVDDKTHYYLSSLEDSVTGLTNESGAVTSSYFYDGFGNLLEGSSPLGQSFGYSGESFDPETGLIYLRARYYDPQLGRFISRDPVLGPTLESLRLNPYPYADNNPVNKSDASGEFASGSVDSQNFSGPLLYLGNSLSPAPKWMTREEFDSKQDILSRLRTSFQHSNGTSLQFADQLQPRDVVTQLNYSYAGQNTFEKGKNVVEDPAGDNLISLSYDAFGNLAAIAGPLGATTSFVYDALNRLIRVIHPEEIPLARVEAVKVENITQTAAQIKFQVSETILRAVLKVRQVNRAAYKTLTLEGPLLGDIILQVNDLLPGIDYEFEIEVIDGEAYHSLSQSYQFKTLGTAPAVSAKPPDQKKLGQIFDVTTTSAILLVGDPDFNPLLVDYYKVTLTPQAGGDSIVQTFDPYQIDSDGGIQYVGFVTLTDLTSNTAYNYVFEVVPSSIFPFTPPPPISRSFKTANPSDTFVPVVITNTIVPDIDQAIVDYQVNESLLWVFVRLVEDITGKESIYIYFRPAASGKLLIPTLTPETGYTYQLTSKDLSGNLSFSTLKNFVTRGFDGVSPLILMDRVVQYTGISAKVTVLSDTELDIAAIDYRPKGTQNWLTVEVLPFYRSFNVTLSQLDPTKEYEYRIRAKDFGGNRVEEQIKDLVLYEARPGTVHESSEGVFELMLDEDVFNAAFFGGVAGWSQEITRKFLSAYADQYDFLIFIPSLGGGKQLNLETLGIFANDDALGSFYQPIRNDVQGIGIEVFDSGSFFGSSEDGEVEGLVYLDTGLTTRPDFRFASSNFTEERNRILWQNILNQELAHRFGSFLTKDAGNPLGMLGRGLSHWGVFFDADFSPMDGNDWIDNGDGTFTLEKSFYNEVALKRSSEVMPFNDLDLYSMGFLEPDQVKPTFVISDPKLLDGRRIRPIEDGYLVQIELSEGIWSSPTPLPTGIKIRGTRREITIDDIIAFEGDRNPSPAQSPKEFKVTFVGMPNEGESPLDALELSQKIARFKDSFVRYFKEMTRGLGHLITPRGQPVMSSVQTIMAPFGTISSESLFVQRSSPSSADNIKPSILLPVKRDNPVRSELRPSTPIAQDTAPSEVKGLRPKVRLPRSTHFDWKALDLNTKKVVSNRQLISERRKSRVSVRKRN